MTDFLYPVNERDPEKWGEVEVLDYFAGLRSGAIDTWYLGSSFRLIETGDRIWVYASAPHSRVVAVGLVEDYPQWSEAISRWWVPTRWDLPVTRVLLKNTPPPVTAPRAPRRIDETELHELLGWLAEIGAPDLDELPDEMLERFAVVRARQGQQDFRRKLIEAYGGQCAVTSCDVQDVLEAAHIEGYSGRNSAVTNGLLLRADIHQLFDKGLLWIDGHNHIRISPDLTSRHYKNLDGRELNRPANRELWPDKQKLRAHRERARREP